MRLSSRLNMFQFVISAFRREVAENCALLGYYAASSCNFLRTFRGNLTVPFSRFYNALIKSSLLYGAETWRLTENNKRRVEAAEMDALRRSSRISRKERIRNVTIRQQIGLEETIIKEIEQNQLTWYGHVQRMAVERLPKIALKWMPKQTRTRGKPKKNWMEGIKKAMNERNVNEGQWEDRKQWSLGVGQRRKTF